MTSPTPQLSALQRRLTDLHTFQLPRLRSCTGPVGLHGELADELRLDLASVRRGLEVAREEVELVEGYEEREGAWRVYEGLEREYKRARTEYRSALLYSKSRISSSKTPNPSTSTSTSTSASPQDARYELQPPTAASTLTATAGGTTYPPRSADFGRGEQDAVQTKTNEVTDALRRTLGTMQVELEKSVMSVQMLEDSTRTLRSTSALYDTYSSLLSTSTQLVKALERADWWDRLVIALAFLLFLLTVGWVIKRRILDRVVGGVGWWVGGSARLVKMGLGGGRGKAKVVEKAGKAVKEIGQEKAGSVVQAVKGTRSVLSGAMAGASTVAVAVASAASGYKGSSVPETPPLADSVVAPPPPASASAISPPSYARDEL